MKRTEHVAVHAAGMNPHQNVRLSGNITVDQSKVTFPVYLAPVLNRPEFSESGSNVTNRFSCNKLLRLSAVPNQLRDRDHLESVLPAKIGKFRNARHSAIRVHDFADD